MQPGQQRGKGRGLTARTSGLRGGGNIRRGITGQVGDGHRLLRSEKEISSSGWLVPVEPWAARLPSPGRVVGQVRQEVPGCPRTSSASPPLRCGAAIVACQVGTALAARTDRASLRSIGLASNRLLLWGIAFELAFAATIVTVPPLQAIFGTAVPGPAILAILIAFPILVWAPDELRRAVLRHRTGR
ncbi:hypothetical protein F6X54_11655 [Micromonospora aurantiaca]|uniref:Cation-transporting P-type ATPase C-terminal domain-containing protein n=1 Tax=Micromonospora aurantiaca (nom. illeg.) TaxID=47850 RepID=A0ABQ6UI38_9ACTN|nr:hypothetical protein F6X54_11655 [Micromonospora aurantiaca]